MTVLVDPTLRGRRPHAEREVNTGRRRRPPSWGTVSGPCHVPDRRSPEPRIDSGTVRRPCHSARSRHRDGLTLLEVVIALAIFLFSLVAIAQLLSLSGDRALTANLRSQAGLLCQSKLAELIAGAATLQSSGYTPFQTDPDWQWRSECNEGDIPGLWNVQVWVKRDRSDGSVLEVSLRQMVLAPARRGSTLDVPMADGSPTTTGQSSSSGSTGGSSSSSSGGKK